MPSKITLHDQVVATRYADVISFMSWMHASWQQPTIREIGEYMGWRSSSTTAAHLAHMEELGLIDNVPNKPRMKRVTAEGMAFAREHGGKLTSESK